MKQTLLIQELKKIKEKWPLLIPEISKIEAKAPLLWSIQLKEPTGLYSVDTFKWSTGLCSVDKSRISTDFCFETSPGAAQAPVASAHTNAAVASVV